MTLPNTDDVDQGEVDSFLELTDAYLATHVTLALTRIERAIAKGEPTQWPDGPLWSVATMEAIAVRLRQKLARQE